MPRKSFSVHSDFYNELRNLTSEQRGDILLALINKADDMESPELDPMCALMVRLMTAQAARISSTNSANGVKGGLAKAANTSERSEAKRDVARPSEGKRNKPSVPDSVSVPDSITEPTENEDGVPAPEAGHGGDMATKGVKLLGGTAQINAAVCAYTGNHELRVAISEWVEARRKARRSPTARAVQLALGKLSSLAQRDEDKIALVNEAIMRGWLTFYPLDGEDKNAMQRKGKTVSTQQSYGDNELNALAIDLGRYAEGGA